MGFHLKNILKALLFSNSNPLSIRDIQSVINRYHQQGNKDEDDINLEPKEDSQEQSELGDIMQQVPSLLTATQIREAMEAVGQELEDRNEVCRLVQGPWGYRLATAPQYAQWVRLLRKQDKPAHLSKAAMETLAIIAYRQPVTRAEIEAIRGVSVDSGLKRLMENELVNAVGRADLPGRPIQYGTNDKFLAYVGLRSIEELPASDVLSANQISKWLSEATAISQQNNISDQDVGLPE